MSEQNPLKIRIDAGQGRKRYAQPKDIVRGRFPFAGVVVNATVGDTSTADLRASGALKSRAVMDRLGVTLPAANPKLFMIADRIGIEFHLGVETDLVALNLAREAYLKQSPVGDTAVTIDLGGFLISTAKQGGNGVIATGAFGGGLVRSDLHDLEVPLVVNLEADPFFVSMHTAVTSAVGTVPFTLWCEGEIMNNKSYTRSEWVQPNPGEADGTDLLTILSERSRANATREYRRGGNIQAVAFHSIETDRSGKPVYTKVSR